MSKLTELVRAKNVDILVHQYNGDVNKMNKEQFIDKESREAKDLRNRYENLLARFDTDKNTIKNKKGYEYKISLDSKGIIGLKGVKPNIRIGSKDGI